MSDAEDGQFESLLQFLQQSRGFDFTGYKRQSLMRRVERRMQMVSIKSFPDYADFVLPLAEIAPSLATLVNSHAS